METEEYELITMAEAAVLLGLKHGRNASIYSQRGLFRTVKRGPLLFTTRAWINEYLATRGVPGQRRTPYPPYQRKA